MAALQCPVCGTDADEFLPGGHNNKPGQKCPVCKSNSRSRLAWLYLKTRTDFFDGAPRRMLHIAPEGTLAQRFAVIPNLDYLTADIDPNKAMVQMDITDIRYPDESFDLLLCSHVLEHVPDDRLAMREMARVLKRSGWAVFMIPMKRESTFEDFSVTDPDRRRELFGHPEHVRRYGRDFMQRMADSGWAWEQVTPESLASPQDCRRYGLDTNFGNAMFVCRRAPAPAGSSQPA